MRRRALFACVLAAGCYRPAGRCASEADCGPNGQCTNGVCVDAAPSLSLAFAKPAAGDAFGHAPIAVEVVVKTLGGAAQPASVQLVAASGGRQVAATLAPVPARVGHFAGSVTATAAGAWILTASAAGPPAATSAPLPVDVEWTGPALATPVTTCADTPCQRDSLITVHAQVSDPHGPVSVTAALDLDAYKTKFPLADAGGGDFTATLDLTRLPFPAFAVAQVGVRIAGTDALGNSSTTDGAGPAVTRLRFDYAYDRQVRLQPPAVLEDGTVVVSTHETPPHVFELANGAKTADVTLTGAGLLSSAPSAGPTALWAGCDDGRVYELDRADLAAQAQSCPGTAVAAGAFTPALTAANPESAYGAFASGSIYAMAGTGACVLHLVGAALSFPATLGAGAVFAFTDTPDVRRYVDQGGGTLSESPATPTPLTAKVASRPAVDASGDVVAGLQDGTLVTVGKTTAAVALLATLGANAYSLAVRGNGDVFAGDLAGSVSRVVPGTGVAWTTRITPTASTARVTTVVAVAEDAQKVRTLALASDGTFAALLPGGNVGWTGQLGHAVTGLNLAPAPPGRMPTAYAATFDGHLLAVCVDTDFDPTSPWPITHHDRRNTRNAASPF